MSENITDVTAPAEDSKGKGKVVKPSKPYDWRADMKKAGDLKDKAEVSNKQAGERLWKACKAGIAEWADGPSAEDSTGEGLYADFLDAYGKSRKGDCSKMKTVALAAKNEGLDLTAYPNLSKAYAAAVAATKTAKAEADEDAAAEEMIASIEAPKTASSVDSAAKILLAAGLDEMARAIIDAAGPQNAVHRAILRALTDEVGGRADAAKAKAKEEADKVRSAEREARAKEREEARAAQKEAKAKAIVRPSTEKAKAAPAKAAPAKAAPAKAAPAKAAPAKAAPAKAAPAKAAPAKAAPVKAKAKPVIAKPVVAKPKA